MADSGTPASASNMDTNEKVVYEQVGVFIHNCGSENADSVCGKLSVIEKVKGVAIEWQQIEDSDYSIEQVNEWDVVNASVGFKAESPNSKCTKPTVRPIKFDLDDIRSFKCSHLEHGFSHITFLQKDGTTHPKMDFHQGNIDNLVSTLERYIQTKRSKTEKNLWLIVDPNTAAFEKSLNELQLFKDRRRQFKLDSYTAAMSRFSRVTKFLYDYVVADNAQLSRPSAEIQELLHESFPTLEINQADAGFELVTQKDFIPRPEIKRGEPLSDADWKNHIDSDGRIIDVACLKEKIFRGGISPSIRHEVWKYLLDVYDYNSTFESRKENRKSKVDDYYRMKLQWKTISDVQEKRFSDLRDRKSLIDKDVSRTDRTHPYFEGEGNENLQIMRDILMTYCMYNFDLGYVQGMSDLLAPILVVMENEVDSFWCFAGFMEKVCRNFEMDQQGMKTQLQELFSLIHFLDPQLCDYLESHESGNLYFCFRWLLIIFKREFKFPDVMRLWEVLWTDLPCKNFHLLFCFAVLDTEKDILMENMFGFTEILKHINDISQHINLEENLAKAESVFIQLMHCPFLPQSIQDILGIEMPTSSNPSSDAGKSVMLNNKSPQSTTSSMETSSIELLYDCDYEAHYQVSLDLNS